MPHQCTNCGRTFADGSKEMLAGCPDCGGNKFQFNPPNQTSDHTAEPSSRAAPGTDRTAAESQSGDVADGTESGETTPAPAPRDDIPTARPSAAGVDTRRTGASAESEAAAETKPEAETREPGTEVETKNQPGAKAAESADPTPSEGRDAARLDAGVGTDDDRPSPENRAQADARSGVVTPDELAAAAERPDEADSDEPPAPSGGRVIEPRSEDRPDLDELREELNDQFESIKIVNPGQYELNLMELYDRDEYIISLREDGRYVIEVPDRWRDDDE